MSSLSISWTKWDNNFEFDLKISKEDENVYTLMFSIFLLKPKSDFGISGLVYQSIIHFG